ncbi:MAG: hypothetical protein RBR81_04345 [Bacteroidales bacterium]|jgi:hypothetical protein|nr:hypothetical protein [Bacteroidales bacterium]
MKKIPTIILLLFVSVFLKAQTLEEIVKKYSSAIKADRLSSVSTVRITGKTSAMGMEMPLTMIMKNPNKVKVVNKFNGREIISVFDGVKGYSINPMTGSSKPVELKDYQLKQVQNSNIFSNELMRYYQNGKLTLEGEENVNGKAAYKLKAEIEGGNPVFLYLDKNSCLLLKTSTSVTQMGTPIRMESYMSDYTETDGVVMPMKTLAKANGMDAAVITFDKVEVDIPVDDNAFSIR